MRWRWISEASSGTEIPRGVEHLLDLSVQTQTELADPDSDPFQFELSDAVLRRDCATEH